MVDWDNRLGMDDDDVRENVARQIAELEAERDAAIAAANAQRDAAIAEAKAEMEQGLAAAEAQRDQAIAEAEEAERQYHEDELQALVQLGEFKEIMTKVFGEAPEVEAAHVRCVRELANHENPDVAKTGAEELERVEARLALFQRVSEFWNWRSAFGAVRAWELMHPEFLGRDCSAEEFREIRDLDFRGDSPETVRRFAELAIGLRDAIAQTLS